MGKGKVGAERLGSSLVGSDEYAECVIEKDSNRECRNGIRRGLAIVARVAQATLRM